MSSSGNRWLAFAVFTAGLSLFIYGVHERREYAHAHRAAALIAKQGAVSVYEPSPDSVVEANRKEYVAGIVSDDIKRDGYVLELIYGKVVVPHSAMLDHLSEQYTLAAWVKFLDIDAHPRIIDKNVAGAIKGLNFDVHKRNLRLCAGASCMVDERLLDNNVWYHVAVTFGYQTGTTLYVNGEPSKEFKSVAPTATNRYPLFIGGANKRETGEFVGYIDEVSLWSRVLAPQEIKSVMMDSVAEMKPLDLLAYYPMRPQKLPEFSSEHLNVHSNPNIVDESSHKLDGKVTNGTFAWRSVGVHGETYSFLSKELSARKGAAADADHE